MLPATPGENPATDATLMMEPEGAGGDRQSHQEIPLIAPGRVGENPGDAEPGVVDQHVHVEAPLGQGRHDGLFRLENGQVRRNGEGLDSVLSAKRRA